MKSSKHIATLARLRQFEEQQSLRQLASATLRVSQAEAALARAGQDYERRAADSVLAQSRGALEPARLSLLRFDLEAVAAQEGALAARLREHMDQVTARRRGFEAARASRRAVEKLLERLSAAETLQASRAEQRMLDDRAAVCAAHRRMATTQERP